MMLLGLLVTLLGQTLAQSTFSPARPPSIPLAVRSPYLSTWQDSTNGGYLAGQWPQFWVGSITGWSGMIRVDGDAYTWMGDPGPASVNQTAFEYTSTRSTFIMNVDSKVEMNITFLSPVSPDDYKLQSLVFSYLSVEVQSTDGKKHDVQLYSDISAEWTSGDRTAIAQWDYGVINGDIAYHKVWKQTQLVFQENDQQAEWGYWYWATDKTTKLTYQSGQDIVVRGNFESNGTLPDTQDTDYRAIEDNFPVFGFAIDLGSVGKQPVETLFSLGLTQELAIQFDGEGGTIQQVPSLWNSYFSTELDAVSFFHSNYASASSSTASFDSQVANDAYAAAGQDYVTITSLAVRQAFGATQLCGTEQETYMFLKEIASDGDTNTVDVIFPLHPIILYTNPALLKLLLEPLFINQAAGQYPELFALHDLGAYPNATGYPDGGAEEQPLEECGNMLIMTLAYAQRTGDTAFLKQYYSLLNQWTQFLIEESLYPQNQLSTDDFIGATPNNTNLAIKGMIGIEAMAVIANMTGNTADAENYTNIAHNYVHQWETTLGVAWDADPPHTTMEYFQNSSYGLLYNLYGDALLSLNLVSQQIYDIQSNFYPTINQEYGVPLVNTHNYTKDDWSMFCAAIASTDTKQLFVSDLAKFIDQTDTDAPFTDLYDTQNAEFPSGLTFIARPVVGGMFALLALPK